MVPGPRFFCLLAFAVSCRGTAEVPVGAPAGPALAVPVKADSPVSPPQQDRRPWEQSSIDGAPHFHEAEQRVQALGQIYPGLVKLSSIGKSVQGRDLWALRVTQDSGRDKPEMVLVGGIHGMEYSEKDALMMLETFLQRREHAAERELLATRVLWVVPMINPDGVVAHLRANARRTDLNRNFGVTWEAGGEPGDYHYPGPTPFSEPESRALRDFLRQRERMNVYADLHRSTWLLLAPYVGGGEGRKVRADLVSAVRALDDAMGNLSVARVPFRIPDQGGFTIDWTWGELGVASFTFEFEPEQLNPVPSPEDDPRYLGLLHLLQNCGSYPRRN